MTVKACQLACQTGDKGGGVHADEGWGGAQLLQPSGSLHPCQAAARPAEERIYC